MTQIDTGEGRRLVLLMSASLDGFLARPDHTLDWFLEPPAAAERQDDRRHQATLAFLGQTGLILVGRRAGTDMAPAWQNSDSPMAQVINALPKVVFSSSLTSIDWDNARVSDRSIEDELPELKAQGGQDIVCFGGARFAHALAAADLIDEYRLTVHPVALGEGLPLWHGLPAPQRLTLVSSTVYADGSVEQTLVRHR
jgi:dihydrofolate reductase